jgi:hypothetical protein
LDWGAAAVAAVWHYRVVVLAAAFSKELAVGFSERLSCSMLTNAFGRAASANVLNAVVSVRRSRAFAV